MSKPYRDEEWLRAQWFSSKTVLEIADEVGCDPSTITRAARDFGLPHKTDASPWRDESTLRRLYEDEKMSIREMADELGCTGTTVWDNMVELGIERRTKKEGHAFARPQVQHWHGPQGYEQVGAEVADGTKRTALVHQLVAIAHGADPYEIFGGEHVVHHKNEHKTDNRPSNLEVMHQSDHGKMSYQKLIESGAAWFQKEDNERQRD